MKRYTLYIIAILTVIVMATSCDGNRVYDNYRAVDIEGWDRTDTIDFDAGRLPSGTYDMLVGFRATSSYPFKQLGLNLAWTVYPSGKSYHKTVKCSVFDDNGHMTGKSGISSDDFLYRVGSINIAKGDSVVFTVSHAMSMDDIPGLTTVGLQLTPSQSSTY